MGSEEDYRESGESYIEFKNSTILKLRKEIQDLKEEKDKFEKWYYQEKDRSKMFQWERDQVYIDTAERLAKTIKDYEDILKSRLFKGGKN